MRNDNQRSPLRSTVVVVLLALTFVSAILTPVAIWARGQVLDTDRYLSTITPLASDPAIQKDVAARVTDAIMKQLHDRGLTAGPALEGAARQAIEATTLRVVESPAFKTAWVTANRQAHTELVRVLNGQRPEGVAIHHGRLTIDLTGVVDVVRRQLTSAGLAMLNQLPPIRLVIDVADASGLQSAEQLVKVLDTLAWALPALTVLLLALAVFASTERRRTALRGFGGILVSMLVLRFAIAIGDLAATTKVPTTSAGDTAVHHYYDNLTSLLDDGVLTIGLIAAVGVLAVAILSPSPRPWTSVALAAAGVFALVSWTWIALAVVAVVVLASSLRGRRRTVTGVPDAV